MKRYLIGSTPGADDSVSVRDLADQLAQDPNTSVIKLIDSPIAPLLVVDMPDDRAQDLKQTYEGRLSIERDDPLSHYSSEATDVG
jgi:hypothetical protein